MFFSPAISALRELFRAKQGHSSSEFSSGELTRNPVLEKNEVDRKSDVRTAENGSNRGHIAEELERAASEHASLVSLNDADEFFDFPEPSDYDQLENDWTPDFTPELNSQVKLCHNGTWFIYCYTTPGTQEHKCILLLIIKSMIAP